MKRYLGFICLIYTGIIIYVIKVDILKNFLASSMHIYIKLALIPLFIMGIVMLFNKNINYKFKFSDLVLLLPVVFIILSGNGRLTESFSKGRVSNFNRSSIPIVSTNKEEVDIKEDEKIEDANEEVEEKNTEYDFTNPDFDVIDQNYYELSGYITFLIDIDKYSGKTIKVKGFTNKMSDFVPEEYFGIGKYVITCCAADAEYVSFIAKYDDFNIKEGAWYEIEGILEKAIDKENKEILSIKIINLNEINSTSEESYVYPCFSYGDGTCKEFNKYNLEYTRK